MEDVLDVYKRSYDETHPLICMDESSKQHIKETRLPIPAKPGTVEKYDTEYERNGVSNMFMFFEPLEGRRHVEVTDQRTGVMKITYYLLIYHQRSGMVSVPFKG
jgi:hypothetical protein